MNPERAERLLEIMREVSSTPGLDFASGPEPLTGGFYAELFAFSLAHPPPPWPAELVARVMPNPELAKKETIVQSAVAAAGYPTPMVRASGGPECGLGGAFLVMDRACGTLLLSGINGLGAVFSALRTLRQIPDHLASSMARLHALDPGLVRARLDTNADLPVTLDEFLAELSEVSSEYQRSDLGAVADWLIEHPLPPSPEVICHGDLHPLNLLMDGERAWVLDWSTALIAPRAFDVGYTALLLEEPPLVVPGGFRAIVRQISAGLAHRFVRLYERRTGITISRADLRWHQAVTCLRALVEVAGWVNEEGVIESRAGHPWLLNGASFASRLSALTGIEVRAR
jgi:aminoglycoside phosphotransferase (APT) family kinase protein